MVRPRAGTKNPSNFPIDGVGYPMRITRLFPMKLKDVTIDKIEEAKRQNDIACMTEVMNLIDCFEKHDFNMSFCQQQSKALESCYSMGSAKKLERKMAKRANEKTGGNKFQQGIS